MRGRFKVLMTFVGLAVFAGVVIGAYRAEIGSAMFARAVKSRLGNDVTKGLPDGLHVALCGTGSPLPNPDRAGPCNVVIAGSHIFVVDIGEGGARNLNRMGVPLGRIEALFLTHFHSDHLDGIGPLMLARWTSASSKRPLPVHGPTGVDQVVDGFNAAYQLDNGYRTAHHGPIIAPPSGAGAVPVPFALAESGAGDTFTVFEEDGLKISAIRVNHGPVTPAVGYRFDYKGRSVVFSGDTGKSPALAAAAKGADILIHEALQPKLVTMMTAALDDKGAKNLAQITRDIVNYHSSPEEAADVAKAARVKLLVLSHIVPPLPSRFFYPAFLGDAARHFEGKIIVGEDGMMFSLPAGRQDASRRKLL